MFRLTLVITLIGYITANPISINHEPSRFDKSWSEIVGRSGVNIPENVHVRNIPQISVNKDVERLPHRTEEVTTELIRMVDNDDERIRIETEVANEILREREKAENAHYAFDSSVQDKINDHSHSRTETREGLVLRGMYSYSDGFISRSVHYEADDKGYRIVKDTIRPIGDGPIHDPSGRAFVQGSLIGKYSITTDDIAKPLLKKIKVEEIDDIKRI